jgi:hypothetical protein
MNCCCVGRAGLLSKGLSRAQLEWLADAWEEPYLAAAAEVHLRHCMHEAAQNMVMSVTGCVKRLLRTACSAVDAPMLRTSEVSCCMEAQGFCLLG